MIALHLTLPTAESEKESKIFKTTVLLEKKLLAPALLKIIQIQHLSARFFLLF